MNTNIPQLIDKLLPESEFISSGVAKINDEALQSFVQDVKTYFATYLGQQKVAFAWELPKDYTAFLCSGIRLIIEEETLEEDIYDIYQVLETTTKPWYSFEMDELKERVTSGKLLKFDTIWLNIGWWGDKHEYFICCDKNHPNFGEVFDCHDCTPWGNSEAYITDSFSSFADFLQERMSDNEEDW